MSPEWLTTIGPLLIMATWAFASATVLPLSSEAVLLGQMAAGLVPVPWLLVAATLGNVAGSCFNWWLGRHVRRFETARWFPFSPATLARATLRFQAYGTACLLLSWLPVVGDPLTFVAGVLRVPFARFLVLVAVGKAARYAVLAYGASNLGI